MVVIAAAVACWVAGFDTIYALQDEAFDLEHGLRSAPAAMGAPAAIRVARAMHLVAIVAFASFGLAAGYGPVLLGAILVAALLLAWEHRLVRPGDYSRLDAAFFPLNGVISAVIMAGALAEVAW